MAAEAGLVPPTRVVTHPPLHALVVGLGRVFGKTLRDSRAAILVVTGLLGVMIVAGGNVMATTYGTPETRQELARLAHRSAASSRGTTARTSR
jgi:hypothetical protein